MAEAQGLDHLRLQKRHVLIGLVGAERRTDDGAGGAAALGLTDELGDSLRYEVSQLGVEVVEVQPSGYPTNFFTNLQSPASTEVTKAYGEVGEIPDAMVKTLMASLEGSGRSILSKRKWSGESSGTISQTCLQSRLRRR